MAQTYIYMPYPIDAYYPSNSAPYNAPPPAYGQPTFQGPYQQGPPPPGQPIFVQPGSQQPQPQVVVVEEHRSGVSGEECCLFGLCALCCGLCLAR